MQHQKNHIEYLIYFTVGKFTPGLYTIKSDNSSICFTHIENLLHLPFSKNSTLTAAAIGNLFEI